jgi:hypothetical protein
MQYRRFLKKETIVEAEFVTFTQQESEKLFDEMRTRNADGRANVPGSRYPIFRGWGMRYASSDGREFLVPLVVGLGCS